VDNFNAA
jgi:glycyl-tRNA synthetase